MDLWAYKTFRRRNPGKLLEGKDLQPIELEFLLKMTLYPRLRPCLYVSPLCLNVLLNSRGVGVPAWMHWMVFKRLCFSFPVVEVSEAFEIAYPTAKRGLETCLAYGLIYRPSPKSPYLLGKFIRP